MKSDERNYEIINIVDASRGFGDRTIVESRSAKVMVSKFEESWICRHGSPKSFSVDLEFCQPFFVKYLGGHGIQTNERPSRSSHKNRIVERSNGTFKSVF